MKIGKRFNVLTKSEYFHYIDNHKKYTDFNTLGLYRSLNENEKLEVNDKIQIRDYANLKFGKTFEFLQLKDPQTYFALITLGKDLTEADEKMYWDNIRRNQQKILSDKRIKHRNFGIYSKHECGYEECHLKGLMIRHGSVLGYSHMYFDADKNKYAAKDKAERIKKERKQKSIIIRKDIED